MANSGESESSCEDVVGPVAPPQSVAGSAHSRQGGSSRAKRCATQTAGDEPPTSLSNDHCYACCQPGLLTHQYRGKYLHQKCMNAVRAFVRLASSNKPLQKRMEQLFFSDPAAWREKILPLVAEDGQKRTPEQRARVREQIERTFTTREEVRESVRLGLTNYVVHRGFWDKLDEVQAEAAFYEELEASGEIVCDSDGEPTVLVRRPPVVREITGRTTEMSSTLGSAQASNAIMPRSEGSSSVPNPDPSDRSSSKRPAPMDSDNEGDATSVLGFSTPQPKSSKGAPPPSDNPKRSVRLLAKTPVASPSPQSASATSRTVLLLQGRTDLIKHVQATCDQLTNRKSIWARLNKRVSTLDNEVLELLSGDPKKIATDIDDKVVKPLKALTANIDKVQLLDVDTKRAPLV